MTTRRQHIAIVTARVAGELLARRKRVESRLTRVRRPPVGCVRVGDVVHFKLVGSGFIGTAIVRRVRDVGPLEPDGVDALRREFEPLVCAGRAYWERRRHARWGVFLWLSRLRAVPDGLGLPPRQFGAGWIVLGGSRCRGR